MEMIDEYKMLCRIVGGFTDWIQGAGGNISIKDEGINRIILKRSGATVSSQTNGLVCDLQKIRHSFKIGCEDVSGAVLDGIGSPSIEAFLHAFPARIIVHAHPYPLLNKLCRSESIDIPCIETKTVNYFKPGIPVANALLSVYEERIRVYFLRNHGVVIMGDTFEDIMHTMNLVSKACFDGIYTDVELAVNLSRSITSVSEKPIFVKTFFNTASTILGRIFLPYTPDIAVFLKESPIIIEYSGQDVVVEITRYVSKYGYFPSVVSARGVFYIIGNSIESCHSIHEILQSYIHVVGVANFIPADKVAEIVNWDKEKLRQNE
jgi:rhamnose utilization protein RhaD (predicted bifunctional aldolase and dehydrogenase)